jgi:hypothetical protein
MKRQMVWGSSLEPEENLGQVALELGTKAVESSMRREVEASCTSYALQDEKLVDYQERKNGREKTDCQRSLRLLETWPGGPQCSKEALHAEAAE